MNHHHTIKVFLALTSLVPLALAASGCKHDEQAMTAAPVPSPSRVSPSEMTAAMQNLPEPDRGFVQQASGANMAAIQMGRLAIERASSPQVRDLAADMVDAHTRLNNDLRQAASQQGVDLPIASLTPKQQALYEQLSQQSGTAFDQAFLQSVRQIQDDTLQSFQSEAQNGKVQSLSNLANQSLPGLNTRVQTVRRAMNQM